MNLPVNGAGEVRLRPGDVVKQQGTQAWLVDRCTESGARIRRTKQECAQLGAGDVPLVLDGETGHIAECVAADLVLERRGREWFENFLAAREASRRSRGGEMAKRNNIDKQVEDYMARKNKSKNQPKDKTKARGGLAADMAQASTNPVDIIAALPPQPDGLHSKGKLGQLIGFSVTSVIRCLGANGVKSRHAAAIMNAQGVEATWNTVDQSCSDGRCGKGSQAPLTKDQVKDLIASAPDPKAKVDKPVAS